MRTGWRRVSYLAALAGVAGLFACLAGGYAARATGVKAEAQWRVGWAAAVDDLTAPSLWTAHPTAPGTATPSGVTYRFIVRPTLSGTAVRLRFANAKDSPLAPASGTRPVTFAAVRVGVRAGARGASLVPGTNATVTFGGRHTVTLAPGGTILSDRIVLTVRQFEDLAVSVYVPRSVVPPLHPQTYVTQYLTRAGAGNRTGANSGAAFTDVQEPVYWLDAVDVLTRAPRAIVAIGDSITDGDQGPKYSDDFGMDRYPTYPDFLARRIASLRGFAQTAVVNEGVNGDSLAGLAGNTEGLERRLEHDLLDLSGVTDVVLEIGTNDITLGNNAAQIIHGITQIVSTLHRRGIHVIGATLVPRGAYAAHAPATDALRARINQFIRTSRIFDGVLDIAKAVGQLGSDNLYQPRYDSGDHLHPNTAGYRAIAYRLNLSGEGWRLAGTRGARFAAQAAGSAHPASCTWMKASLSANARATMLLHAMSLSEKVAMTYQKYSILNHYGAAGYIPGVPSLCLPDLVFNDAGQGVADTQTGTTAFPAPIAQSSSWDPQLQDEFGRALGQEARGKGIDVQLAPGIETDRVPMNGRNWEYMGEDPFLSGQGAAAEVRGVQSQHVIVTLKHFIANSQETDRGNALFGSSTFQTDSSDVDPRTLEEMYAAQYDIAIRQGGAMGVMCSYNRINSVYSCQNARTLGMLDKQFGFRGFVVSDWGATHSTASSAKAGLNIEMNSTPGVYFGPALEAAVQAGEVPMSTLNGMVLRILRAMFQVGVFDHPPASQPAASRATVSTPAHVSLARRISEEGTVLLKNENHVLPLRGRHRTIAVIGPAAGQAGAENEYNGQGSGHVPLGGSVAGVVSPLQAISRRAAAQQDRLVYADGSDTPLAVSVAKTARVAVVFAGDSETEGIDRSNLTLRGGTCSLFTGCTPPPVDQNALIAKVAAANPDTVVVLNTGGPVLMPWVDHVKGIFEAWYPGQQDGNAIAPLLFGDVDPSGHLPETFPAAMRDLPIRSTAQWPGVTKPGDIVGPHSLYSERLLVGYRWYETERIRPLFPFGYGLSYTTFRFSRMRLSATRAGVSVTFTLSNTGHRTGADVAQVYVGDPRAAAEPVRQLKGYQRVSLRAGQSKRVTISLNQVSFAHWSNRANTWVVAPGSYAIYVGDSSQRLPLQATLNRRSQRLPSSAY